MQARHPIRAVAARTGLSTHLIRVWERRYQAVTPIRSQTGQRLYSDANIRRLGMLRRATDAGESISQVAGLSDEQLEQLLVRVESTVSTTPVFTGTANQKLKTPSDYVSGAMDAIRHLDAQGLDDLLAMASLQFSQPQVIERIIHPLLVEMGDRWVSGELRVVNEHLASAVIRSVLGSMVTGDHPSAGAPKLMATTPTGQLHECGALMSVVAARRSGWNATYLGPNLPAEDIASAARQEDVRVLLLSIVYPADDPHVAAELRKLRRLLGEKTVIIVGGRAIEGYTRVLDEIEAVQVNDLGELRTRLDAVRAGDVSGRISSTINAGE